MAKKKKTIPNQEFVKSKASEIADYALTNSRSDKKKLDFPFWYAGVTNNPKIREVGHKSKLGVDKLDTFKPYYAHTFANARAIENYLCDNFGFDHCKLKGGAKDDTHENPSKWVYVYFIPSSQR